MEVGSFEIKIEKWNFSRIIENFRELKNHSWHTLFWVPHPPRMVNFFYEIWCQISLFFLEKKGEIFFPFTLFEKWKWNRNDWKLRSRSEISKISNSRESRLSLNGPCNSSVCVKDFPSKKGWLVRLSGHLKETTRSFGVVFCVNHIIYCWSIPCNYVGDDGDFYFWNVAEELFCQIHKHNLFWPWEITLNVVDWGQMQSFRTI